MNSTIEPESGTTMTEVLVVVTITAILAVPLLTMIRSAARIQNDHRAAEAARIDVELALLAMAEDLRTGSPVAGRPRGTNASDTVGVEVADETGADAIVYWSVGRQGLRRIEADAETGRVRQRTTIASTVVANSEAVFRYYDADGRELDPLTEGSTRLAECTALVEVRLSVPVGDDREDDAVTASARHAVRSRPPGVNGC